MCSGHRGADMVVLTPPKARPADEAEAARDSRGLAPRSARRPWSGRRTRVHSEGPRLSLTEHPVFDLGAQLADFDVRDCECSDPAAFDLLMSVLEASAGSLDALNLSLRTAISEAHSRTGALTV